MHYFEEEYQKRFKEGQSTDGVAPDQLWANIESALPPEEKPKRKAWLWVSLVLFLIFGILTGAYHFYFNDKKDINTNREVAVILRDEAISNTNTVNTAASTADEQVHTNSSLDTTGHKAETIISLAGDDLVLPPPTTEDIVVLKGKRNGNSNPTTVPHKNKLIPTENNTITNTVAPANKHKEKALPITLAKTTSGISAEESNTLAVVAKLATSINSLALPPRKVALPAIVLPAPVVGSTKALPLSLEFFTGISFWEERSTGNDSPFAQQLDEVHKSEAGLTTALEIRLPVSSSIDLISGFHYTYSRTVFEYTRSWDTMIYRNNIPGADLINAVGLREVKHHNSMQTLTIPLLAGWSSQGPKLQLGINAGVGLNLILETAGRSLNASGEVFTYSAASAPYPDVYLSYHLQPHLSYPLGQQFRLHFRPGISYQALGESEIYGLKRSALRTDWSLGVSWRRE
ncbi:hypothetical protein [Lewinella cohaerens]|uniref:hypothetical protein n=1 Tax=Lewinella cohaerens TaxID=70995 RepID=UPI00035F6EA4|nr:hypothetical protein [Lewinella cohaerens]